MIGLNKENCVLTCLIRNKCKLG